MTGKNGYALMLKPFPHGLANEGRVRALRLGVPFREYMRLALEEKIQRDDKRNQSKTARQTDSLTQK